ncbi:trem-like transcript 1 protein [Dasypus novemcinctus]|uniref:trem-like transcript 1 protein n=1 Tax=Dasypus novemcinctus TaxID=9361 RepID=UPI00265FA4D1|nr:trem-like transcript 1 protein [Dasypus novemcinctus]
MGFSLLLLLLLGLAGQGSVGSLPEALQAPVGSAIQVQCHYRLQDVKARKVWCRFLAEGCQPVVTSAVDRRAPEGGRTFLTDLGGGLLQVEMVALEKEDAGEYGCVVEGAMGPQTVHRIALQVLPPDSASDLKEDEEDPGSLADDPSAPSQDEKSILLIWGAVLLLGLLVAAVVLLVVMVRRKGNRLDVCGRFQNSRVSGTDPSSVGHRISDSGLAADVPLDVPYARLNSPPSFDDTTYTSLPLDPSSGKPPPSSPLPPKVLSYSNPVTPVTDVFPRGDKGGEVSCEPVQDPPNSQTPPS